MEHYGSIRYGIYFVIRRKVGSTGCLLTGFGSAKPRRKIPRVEPLRGMGQTGRLELIFAKRT